MKLRARDWPAGGRRQHAYFRNFLAKLADNRIAEEAGQLLRLASGTTEHQCAGISLRFFAILSRHNLSSALRFRGIKFWSQRHEAHPSYFHRDDARPIFRHHARRRSNSSTTAAIIFRFVTCSFDTSILLFEPVATAERARGFRYHCCCPALRAKFTRSIKYPVTGTQRGIHPQPGRDLNDFDIHSRRSVLSKWRGMPLNGSWKLSARAKS